MEFRLPYCDLCQTSGHLAHDCPNIDEDLYEDVQRDAILMEDTLEAIADSLRAHGFPAWREHHTVAIAAANSYAWIFGTANETWAGDLVDEFGEAAGITLTTEHPSHATDVLTTVIAADIAALILNAYKGNAK